MFSSTLQAAVQSKLLHPYIPSRNGPRIFHLFFVDDYFFIAKAKVGDALTLKLLMDAYCHYSGQSINTSKSFIIISPAIDPLIKQTIVSIFGMPRHRGVWKYLDVPIFNYRLCPIDFNFITEKILNKIQA